MGDLVHTGSKYTDEDRRRAVAEYCVKGLMSSVSEATGIPQSTLCDWQKSEWWHELTEEVRNEISDVILSQNLQIATKAGQVALDSLENGDEKLVIDKQTGQYVIKRVKPSGRDAAVISGIFQDKARVQLNLPTSISSNAGTAQLQALADQFAKLAGDHKRIERSVVAIQEIEEAD